LIGSVGVDDYAVGSTSSAELGYWVARDARRAGVAHAALRSFLQYAFRTLELERIIARTIVANEPSSRLLEDLGFAREGILRRFTRIGEAFHDTLVFGLLREDFTSTP
jgi:ribosomal-protein-alanine N-acetyltransferase